MPPQGCRSRPDDLDQPDPAGAHRRLHRHGHLTRSGLASSSASVIQRLVTAASAAIISASFAVIASLSRPGLRDVEIEPAFGLADRAARDRIGQHRGEQMQRRVHAHPRMPDRPVDRGRDGVADRQDGEPGAGTWAISVLPGSVNTTLATAKLAPFAASRAAVSGLAAGGGVEHRAVEHHAAIGGEGDDTRLAVLQIGILAADSG